MKFNLQRGMSSLGFLFTLGFAGFFLLALFRVGPLYLDNYFVGAAMNSMADENFHEINDAAIRKKLFDYFTINNIRDIKHSMVKIERDREGTLIKVDYEKRVNFLGNLDVVASFENHLHSSQR